MENKNIASINEKTHNFDHSNTNQTNHSSNQQNINSKSENYKELKEHKITNNTTKTQENDEFKTENSKLINNIIALSYLILVVILSIYMQTNINLIIVGTLPLFAHVILIYFLNTNRRYDLVAFWIFPVILNTFFFIVWKYKTYTILTNMKVPELVVFNLIISYLINVILLYSKYFSKTKSKKTLLKLSYQEYLNKARHKYYELSNKINAQKSDYEHKIHHLEKELKTYKSRYEINQNNLSLNLRSIEDKCKAINFAIGRVYSNKKGGNEDIRNALNINKELYNTFSQISASLNEINPNPLYKVELLKVLEQIHFKFLQLELKEKDIFSLASYPETPVNRDETGNDKIIEVLAKNDKDPVLDYFNEAKEITARLIEFLKKK